MQKARHPSRKRTPKSLLRIATFKRSGSGDDSLRFGLRSLQRLRSLQAGPLVVRPASSKACRRSSPFPLPSVHEVFGLSSQARRESSPDPLFVMSNSFISLPSLEIIRSKRDNFFVRDVFKVTLEMLKGWRCGTNRLRTVLRPQGDGPHNVRTLPQNLLGSLYAQNETHARRMSRFSIYFEKES